MSPSANTPADRSRVITRLAKEAGFDLCGIAQLGPIPHASEYLDWLAAGRGGTMGYLHRRKESRVDPRKILQGARSAIVLAVNYKQAAIDEVTVGGNSTDSPVEVGPNGRIAMYAWGKDYHVILTERLNELVSRIRDAIDEPFDATVGVDTTAIIERELAAAAGLGWIGKNTMVLHPALGSYFFITEIITTLELEPDVPVVDHCGSCTRCLDACPTGAFPAPYHMDATRCISYLTIEYRGEIDPKLAAQVGDWLFGCDICQDVCPFNRKSPLTSEPHFAEAEQIRELPVNDVVNWSDEHCREATSGRALDRAKPGMWRRNAEVVRRNASSTGGTDGDNAGGSSIANDT